MRVVLTLVFMLSLSCLSMAQEVLFYDDFGNAEARLKKNIHMLRPDLWQRFRGYDCHAGYVNGVGGVAYPLQFDTGPTYDPGANVQCVANSSVSFQIDPGHVYTDTIVFRINEYDAFANFHKGFQRAGGGVNLTPTLARSDTSQKGTDFLVLEFSARGAFERYANTQVYLRPYEGQWLTYETSVDTRTDGTVLLSSRLLDPSQTMLGLVNIVISNPDQLSRVLGQPFTLHNHPLVYLSSTERVLEIKEIRVTRR